MSALVLAGCVAPQAAPQRFQYTQMIMGVQARLILCAVDEESARGAAEAAFAAMNRMDFVASDYRVDSLAVQLCEAADALPPGAALSADPALARLLAQAAAVSEASDGAFDVTVGPLSQLWRAARRGGRLPDRDELAAALARVGWWNVSVGAGGVVRIARRGVRLDFGGIAKGAAAQEASDLLTARGLPAHVVALAGDIVVGDAPRGSNGWRIGVRCGCDDADAHALLLQNAAISTSGDNEQWFEVGGVRYGHIIDPRTGMGVTTRACATVYSARGVGGATVDALATSLCVMSPGEAAALLGRWDGRVEARVIWPGDAPGMLQTPGYSRRRTAEGLAEAAANIHVPATLALDSPGRPGWP